MGVGAGRGNDGRKEKAMNPTMNLRFVELDAASPHPSISGVAIIKPTRVLQQQFSSVDEKTGEIKTEWRTVPFVKEE